MAGLIVIVYVILSEVLCTCTIEYLDLLIFSEFIFSNISYLIRIIPWSTYTSL